MKKIKIAVVDDHNIVRAGLIGLLKSYTDISIEIEASNGEELINKLQSTPVDVILLDIKMPIMDGLEAVKLIRTANEKVMIIMLTMHEEGSYVLKLLEAKANGYLLKTSNPDEIYTAIKSCLVEGFYFNDFVKDILAKDLVHKNKINPFDSKPYIEFDDRERNVLKMLCEEKNSKEIGKALFLSKRTIDACRAKLLEKTNTHNTVGLVLYCTNNKIFE